METNLIERIKNKATKLPKDNLGLFTGKSGSILIMYVLNRQFKDPELKKIADTLLKEVMEDAISLHNLTFDKGLLGIGCAVNYLLANGYVEGNPDDLLSDIDALLYKTLKDKNVKIGISCSTGLIGILIYLVERIVVSTNRESLNYKLKMAALREVVNKLEQAMPTQFVGITKDVYTSIIFNYPILFIYLKKAIDLNIYSSKILCMVQTWTLYMGSYIPYYNINKLYMLVALAYLNTLANDELLNKQISLLIFSFDFNIMLNEIDSKIMNINEGYAFVAILLYSAENLFHGTEFEVKCHNFRKELCAKHNHLYKQYLNNIPEKNFNLNLINGFLGIELLNTLYPDVLKP